MTRHLLIALLVSLTGLVGCGEGGTAPIVEPEPLVEPNVEALSTYGASVGTVVEVYGTDFRAGARHELVFSGQFDGADGSTEPVSFTSEAAYRQPGVLRWGGFGPYDMPFAAADKTGTFFGTVGLRTTIENADGTDTVLEDASPLSVSFDVEPSLIIRDFQPITASCAGQIKRAISGMPYHLEVEAIGFEPVAYTYTVSRPEGSSIEATVVRRISEGQLDSVGSTGNFVLEEVPEGQQSYVAIVSIDATDETGATLSTSFGVTVHRPLEVYYNGGFRIAQIYEPTPVSSCIPGGEAGRRADYSENMSETRSRSYNISWNDSWLSSRTVSSSTSATVGLSETNGIGFATTNGEDFRWDVGAEVGVKGSIPIINAVEGSFSTKLGQSSGQNRSQNQSTNRTEGLNQSTTTTDSESLQESETSSEGGGFSWSVSTTESVGRGFGGTVIANTYGVFYRQTVRIVRPAAIVTYNQCGEAQHVGDIDFTDWIWSTDLALGNSCPDFPRSNLPAAECRIEPCTGE